MAYGTIVKHNGAPAIRVNGEIFPPMMATVTTSAVALGSRERKLDEEYYRALGRAGVRLFFVMCNNLSLDPGAIEDFEREAQTILRAVPDAYLFVRLTLIPSADWIAAHPREVVTYSDGRKIPTTVTAESFYVKDAAGMPSLCSDVWRREMGQTMLRTVRRIRYSPVGARIVGYFFGAGGTSEWYYINPIEDMKCGAYADLSDAFARNFRAYLDRTYGAGVADATIPDAASRFYTEEVDRLVENPGRVRPAQGVPPAPSNGTNHGSFLDIDRFVRTYDFYRAWHEATADSVIYFCRLVKEHFPDALTGAFYGSMGCSEIVWASNGAGVRRVLDSGVVDFLSNPGVYENRQPGGFTGQRVPADSFRLRNTVYVVEEDTRTHAENDHFREGYETFDLQDTLNVLKRDFGRNISDGLQAWWFDQHVGGGRYKYAQVYELFARQQHIAADSYAHDREKGHEIAFLYDEESVHVASAHTTDDCVQVIRNYEIARIGAGVDSYFHNDMADPAMPDYKMYVFTNCFYLSDEDRRQIREKLRGSGALALFLYGNGLINPDRSPMLDVSHIGELTGIRCAEIPGKHSPLFRLDVAAHPCFEGMDARRLYGVFDRVRRFNQPNGPKFMPRSYLYPLLCADDPCAVPLAHYAMDGRVAIAMKKEDGFTSVYCGAKYVNADLLRAFARMAGCHIYEADGNVLYQDTRYLTVHAAQTGQVTLHFPHACSVFEVYEDKCYAKDVSRISFPMACGQTKMFRMET